MNFPWGAKRKSANGTSRAVAKSWITVSPFELYKCQYKEPEPDWPPYEQVMKLKDWEFDKEILNEARDTFIFEGFTGLAFNETYYYVRRTLLSSRAGNGFPRTGRKAAMKSLCPCCRWHWIYWISIKIIPNVSTLAVFCQCLPTKSITAD